MVSSFLLFFLLFFLHQKRLVPFITYMTWAFVIWSWMKMFSIDRKSTNENGIDDVGVKLLLSKDDVVYIVRYGTSLAIVMVFALHIISTLTAIRGPSSAILIIVMSIPFLSIGYELNPYSEALVSNVFPIFNLP